MLEWIRRWWLKRKVRQLQDDLKFLRSLENDPEKSEGAKELIPLVEADIAGTEAQM